MNFSLGLISIAVVLFLSVLYWTFNFIILYHLTRFGVGVQPKKMAAVFLLGSVVLFSVSILLFTSLDLSHLNEIHLFNI